MSAINVKSNAGVADKKIDFDERLKAAAEDGNEAGVREILALPQFVYSRRAKVLLELIEAGNVVAVRFLLQHIDPNSAIVGGKDALSTAAATGNVPIVEALLAHKADAVDDAMDSAVRNGHRAVCEVLLRHGANVKQGNLVARCIAQHPAVAIWLLQHGASPEDEGHRRCIEPPLITAARAGNLPLCAALIQHKANPACSIDSSQNSISAAPPEIVAFLSQTCLPLACETGNVELVTKMLSASPPPDVNQCTTDGASCLMLAAKGGHVEVMRLLIQRKAVVNIKDGDNHSALCLAARSGSIAACKLLLEARADAPQSEYAVQYAAQHAHAASAVELCTLLLEAKCDADADAPEEAEYAVKTAANNNNLALCRLLLEHNARPEFAENCSPKGDIRALLTIASLHAACELGDVEAVMKHCENGANVNDNDSVSRRTPIQIAAGFKNDEDTALQMVRALLLHKADPEFPRGDLHDTALDRAVACGHFRLASLVIEHKADVQRALNGATLHGGVSACKFLLEHKAQADILYVLSQDSDQFQLLTNAVLRGHLDVCRVLVEAKADVKRVRGQGLASIISDLSRISQNVGDHKIIRYLASQCFPLACESGDVALVREMLAAHLKPDINEALQYGLTGLILAARAGHMAVVQLLLDSNADLRSSVLTTAGHFTALHFAADNSRDAVVQLLLERNADLATAVNPFNFAGNIESAAVLLEHKANINATALNNWPLASAFTNKRESVAEFLINSRADIHQCFISTSILHFARFSRLATQLTQACCALACEAGDKNLVTSFLTRSPAVVNHALADGTSGLMLAAKRGNLDMVKLLIERKAATHLRTLSGSSALSMAACDGALAQTGETTATAWFVADRQAMCESLLANNAALTLNDPMFKNPITDAALFGDQKLVEYLLAQKGDLQPRPKVGQAAPLMAAAMGGHVELVKLLIARAPESVRVTFGGLSILNHAKKRQQLEVRPVLAQTCLPLACEFGDVKMVREFLAQGGAWVNESLDSNYTALMLAVEEGHEEVVKILLERKASTALCGYNGHTAMSVARFRGQVNIMRLLDPTLPIKNQPRDLEQLYAELKAAVRLSEIKTSFPMPQPFRFVAFLSDARSARKRTKFIQNAN